MGCYEIYSERYHTSISHGPRRQEALTVSVESFLNINVAVDSYPNHSRLGKKAENDWIYERH